MKHYIAPEVKFNPFRSADVIANSLFFGVYDENKNSYDFWDLENGFGEQYGQEANPDPVLGDW